MGGRPTTLEQEAMEMGKIRYNEDDDFQKELKINKYRLDEECLSHASRYAYWAEACALAKGDVAKAKDNLEYVKALRSVSLRNLYMEAGEKFTEAKLENATLTDPDVLEAKKLLRDATEVYEKMLVAVNAMEARKSELDNLVKLYVAGYFSNVATGNGTRKDANEQTSNDIRRKLNSKEENND